MTGTLRPNILQVASGSLSDLRFGTIQNALVLTWTSTLGNALPTPMLNTSCSHHSLTPITAPDILWNFPEDSPRVILSRCYLYTFSLYSSKQLPNSRQSCMVVLAHTQGRSICLVEVTGSSTHDGHQDDRQGGTSRIHGVRTVNVFEPNLR